jgi:hypothetical protein
VCRRFETAHGVYVMIYQTIPTDWYPIEVKWDDGSVESCADFSTFISEVEPNDFHDQSVTLYNMCREWVYYRLIPVSHFPSYLRLLDRLLNDSRLEFSTAPFEG